MSNLELVVTDRHSGLEICKLEKTDKLQKQEKVLRS
jgi:hypothetical protein